ncbi:MAG TPA: hypothetical protein DEB24_07315 [Coriobacteriia bacterium]|nr:hypothetical protein [Coriobacteriia bacterium]
MPRADSAAVHTSASSSPKQTDTVSLESMMELERRLEKARALLIQNPLCRPVLYRILETARDERIRLGDLETMIADMPEYDGITQPPYILMQWLVDVSTLDLFELDDAGTILTEESKQGLSADEIDDKIVDFSFKTSELGVILLKELEPAGRLEDLLTVVPERYDTYMEVLEFLKEPRSFAQIDELLRGRDILMFGKAADDRPLQPSVFVDKLAATGIVVYNNGWQITVEGKEFLEQNHR